MTTTNPQSTLSFPRETFAKLSPHPYLLANLQPSPSTTTPNPPTQPSLRANGRLPTDFRTPHINNGSLTHAEGSSVVRIGDTTVVCGIRAEILLASNVPNYRSDQGNRRRGYGTEKDGRQNGPLAGEVKELDLLVPNIELATGCNPSYMPGQAPSVLAQGLSTRILSLLHSSSIIEDEELRIWYTIPSLEDDNSSDDDEDMDNEGSEDGKEAEKEIKAWWTLYIDILFISLDGNPFDAAWAAVVSALHDVRLPKASWDAEREMIVCEDEISKSRKLSLKGCPVSVTAVVFKGKGGGGERGKGGESWILIDPDTFEEGLCDECVTVTVDLSTGETRLLGISKQGGCVVGREEIRVIVGLAEERWMQLSGMLAG